MSATARHTLSDAFLGDLRSRANLPEMVARGVQLRRSGRTWTGLCPFHGERRPSFAVYSNGYHCFGCGARGDAIEWVMQEQRVSFLDAVVLLSQSVGLDPPVRRQVSADRPPLASVEAPALAGPDDDAEQRKAAAKAMWLGAMPKLHGTPVAAYLRARGIDLQRLARQPRSLRFAPDLWCSEARRRFPAMVAAICAGDGRHVATHRTWLEQSRDGSWGKAPIQTPKKVLGPFRGGSIRIARGDSGKPLATMPPRERIIVGEGIETCLSVAVACPELRILSGVSMQGMALLELPEQADSITLLADNDDKAEAVAAFQRVLNHHIGLGRDVRVARSPFGKDFNDAIKEA